MHSVTRLTCTFWVTKSVWADSAGVRGRHWNFRKWNFSYFIPSILCQKLRMRNYAHFEQYWFVWRLFSTKSGGFLSDSIDNTAVRPFHRKFRENNNRQTDRNQRNETVNVSWIFRPCHANSTILKPLKAVQRHLENLIILWR